MLLVTADQMRRADRYAIETAGIPGAVLMENAAQGVARVVMRALGEVDGVSLAAFCGKGNNGGDGFAALRILANRGAFATAYLFGKAEGLTGDAKLNHDLALACGVEVVEVPQIEDFEKLQAKMAGHDFYLDAMLGIGLASEVRGVMAHAIELLNILEAPVLAVDIPSGLCADTGCILGLAVAADMTVTFGLCKLGLALEPGELAGELSLVDISLLPAALEGLDIRAAMLDADQVARALPARPLGGHKGIFGHLVIAGGSPGMTGAPCLAAWGGIRSGAGLVSVALPQSLNPSVEAALISAMTQPLPETSEGGLAMAAGATLMQMMQARQALVLGPGLSTQEEAAGLVRALCRELECPLVLDADGLSALAQEFEPGAIKSRQAVLTPHPGEAGRLLGKSAKDIQADRPAAARRLAAESGAVVVLKGARSLIAEPGGRIWVNPTGNPLLATGGSGDVLSGLIGGLMAQGAGALEAACAGAFVHGLAADLAQEQYGQRGLAAEELVAHLPEAFMALECDDQGPDDD